MFNGKGLVSELLSHADFQQLLSAVEVYIDKKMLPQMQTLNAVYRLAETSIKEHIGDTDPRDKIMLFLQPLPATIRPLLSNKNTYTL